MREANIDSLRMFAALCTVLGHICNNYIAEFVDAGQINTPGFWVADIITSATRVSVLLFLLISGRYLVRKAESVKVFYKKRITRILMPFVFWAGAYSLFAVFLNYHSTGQFHLRTVIGNLFNGHPFYHLWYLYLITAIYLATPFLNFSLQKISQRKLLAISLILISAGVLGHASDFFDETRSRLFFWPFYYIGFFLYGHASKNTRMIPNGVLLTVFVASIAITSVLFFYAVSEQGSIYFHHRLSPFIVIAALAVYKLFSQLKIRPNAFSRLTALSFGIYLIHPAIIELINLILPLAHISYFTYPETIIVLKFGLVAALSVYSCVVLKKTQLFHKVL